MRPWLRIGKRLEYTMAVIAVVNSLLCGFILTRGAPVEIRWMVWIYVAGFGFLFCFAALLVGRWWRRKLGGSFVSVSQTPKLVRPKNRGIVYAVAAAVTAISATEQAARHLFAATTADIFFWNFAILAFLIGTLEFVEWRKRRSATTSVRR